MEIDEVRIEKNLSARKMPAKFTTGLARTAGLLKAGKPLKILALGDSITWRGRKKSYAYYLGLKLKEKFKSDVTDCNRAIAGYTARGGAISLPRDIRAMPDPDLVFIFFGANDAKAIGNGLTEAGFAAHIGDLIDRVRIATGGRPDFMVITGVPRMFNSSDPVGKIVKGAIQAARDKQATVCDTYPVFLQMPKEERKKYISGAPHISDGGQQKMADLVFDRICALIDQ
jgi:lysophospholipase L1-like esterase